MNPWGLPWVVAVLVGIGSWWAIIEFSGGAMR